MIGSRDWSVYLVTDPALLAGRDLAGVVSAAIGGGVTAVQLRDKDATDRDLASTGRRLLGVCRGTATTFIVNDRVDLALEIGADGAHVGQDDMPLSEARRRLGAGAVLGVSVSTVEEAVRAERGGASYLGISPVFATPTKPDTPDATGIEGIAAIRAAVSIPIVAIGGIDESNASLVVERGADGVAVVRAIMGAADPGLAARLIASRVREGMCRR